MTIEVLEKPKATPGGTTEPILGGVPAYFLEGPNRLPREIQHPYELSATPDTILIGSLSHPFLRLRRPIRAEVIVEDDAIGVWSAELEELGSGPYLSAAIDDFQRSVVELYFTLESEQARIGGDLAVVWRRLQDLVAPTR